MAQAVAEEARRWIETPYRHQASMRGYGTDCLGLLRGVWRHVFGEEPEAVPAYTMDWDEVSSRDILRQAAERHLVLKDGQEPDLGDVILFRMRRGAVAKHLGLCVSVKPTYFVHAYSGHGVVESAFTVPWKRRVDGIFAFPDRLNS